MHISDDIRLGPVYAPNPGYLSEGNPAPMELGIGPMGRVYVFDIVPVASGAALLGALQAATINVPMTLVAGAGVTTRYDASNNTTRYVLDCARRVTLTSAGNLAAVNYTIRGFDFYGQPMSQTIAGPNANTVATTKAFKEILSVTPSATNALTASIGFNDAFGLPVRVNDAGYISDPKWAGTLAQDAGTFVPADGAVATPSTGDVRGIYTPSSAANGARRLVMGIYLSGSQVGPQATRLAALGVDQA